MLDEAAVAALQAENAELRATNAALHQSLTLALGLLAQLQARVEELETAPPPPPPVGKSNTPRPDPASKPPRRQRAADQNHGRRYDPPTEIRDHAYEACPDCGHALYGHSIARKRQVLDLPPPPPVRVIEYHVLKRYCPVCQKYQEPELRLDGLVIGHSRVSVRVMALVGWMRTVLRLPLRQIRTYLAQLHGLQLSVGEIAALLDELAAAGQAAAATILEQVRGSPVIHSDETYWRQAGQNGYVWTLTTADGTCYFHYDRSRAGAVSRRLLGAMFRGTLCTDFYAGYNEHLGPGQRCWAHLLRDLAKLVEQHAATHPEVVEWVGEVVALYRRGRELEQQTPAPSQSAREALYAELLAGARELGRRWAQQKGHPGQALARRLLRHDEELFQYVRQAAVEATNNRAERAIRPLAVARKISGGTRSSQGSTTRMTLQTLFATWLGRGLDPLAECLNMLGAEPFCPQSEQ